MAGLDFNNKLQTILSGPQQHIILTMSPTKTIVFGPTGGVGSVTALSAQQHGAKVYLAMRDPTKPIPGLSTEAEAENGFERVQADLYDAQSVQDAVRKTGATRAFIYIAHGSPDHMRSTIEALKSAGIDFVVFLSSGAVKGDLRSIQPAQLMGFLHGQVEIGLEEVFGTDGFVAVRPAYFASNAFWWTKMVREGEVKTVYPEAQFDWIAPGDIGSVCGAVLSQGRKQEPIYLYGPELVSLRDGVGAIGQAIGKEIKLTQVDEEEGVGVLIERCGLPEPVAHQMVQVMKRRAGNEDDSYSGVAFEKGKRNIQKYTGREPTTLQEWANENKAVFGT